MDSQSNCIPPPPPPPIKGQLSSGRLPTQLPAEAPACVQNAMMTKDKKPFTYTPGGIDLSQIKSPRMAKRVQKNALSEGVSGPPKVSPLVTSQSNTNQQSTQDIGAFAVGMPFQVLPPPPPPPAPVLPPSTPQQASNLTKLITDVSSRNNKQQQQTHIDPTPINLRPEIKIPANPMANLKPTLRPKANTDFWVDECKDDKETPSANLTESLSVINDKRSFKEPSSEPPTPPQKNSSKGQLTNIYIPNQIQEDKQLFTQTSPSWMSSKMAKPDQPEWAHQLENEGEVPTQIGPSARTPITPNISPQPFYGASPIPSNYNLSFLPTGASLPNTLQYTPQYNNPNQYVNQGYQYMDYNRQNLFSPNLSNSRTVPIQLEENLYPSGQNYHKPAMQSPVILKNDHRAFGNQSPNPMAWGNNHNNVPTQSRSFKMLQKITNSYTDGSESDTAAYQSGTEEIESHMKQIELTADDQKYMNSIKSQAPISKSITRQDCEEDTHQAKPYVPPSEQQVFEPKKYTGANIPSRSFRLLQAMTQPENAGPGQSDM